MTRQPRTLLLPVLLLALSLGGCAVQGDDSSPLPDDALDLVEQDTTTIDCDAQLTRCEDRADRKYDSCTYGAELTFDYCQRNNGQNCDINYLDALDRCDNNYDTAIAACDTAYCTCTTGHAC